MIKLKFNSFGEYQQDHQRRYEEWRRLCDALNSPNPGVTMMPDPREAKMSPHATPTDWVEYEAYQAWNRGHDTGYEEGRENAQEAAEQEMAANKLRLFLKREGIDEFDVPGLLGFDEDY
jgi:hypothetical protein